MKIEYETITTVMIIIDQMIKFLKNSFCFKFELKKPGRTKIKIAIKKMAGTICSKVTF